MNRPMVEEYRAHSREACGQWARLQGSRLSQYGSRLIALVGCSIAAVLAIGAPMSAGGSQTAMPTSEWRSLFDQRVFRASSHEPRMQRLVGTVKAPVGQGWG